MNKRWLIALLIISFAFNLAVVFSFVYFKVMMPPPPPPPPHKDMPHFSPRDRIRTPDAETIALNRKFNEQKIALMEELAKDPVNEASIATIIDSSVVTQNILERRLGQRLLENRRKMTAIEAKEHFLKRAEFLRNRNANKHHKRSRR